MIHRLNVLAVASLGLASVRAQAICLYDAGSTYGGELDAADHVFVATITQATLVGDPALLQRRAMTGKRSIWNSYKIDYAFSRDSRGRGAGRGEGRWACAAFVLRAFETVRLGDVGVDAGRAA